MNANQKTLGMCGKFNKALGGIVVATQPQYKGVINGVATYAVDIYVNGSLHDGAWGTLASINQWLQEKGYC